MPGELLPVLARALTPGAWRRAAALVALLLAPSLAGVAAADSRPEDRLRQIRKEIREEERIVEKIRAGKTSLLDSLDSLDRRIVQTRERLRACRKRNRELDWQIQHLREELARLEAQVSRRRRDAGERLDVFYRLGRDGMLPLLFSSSTIPRKLRDLDALRRILDRDWVEIRSYDRLLAEKAVVEEGLESRIAEERGLEGEIRDQERELLARRRQKDELLSDLEKDEKLHRRLLEELNESAGRLEALIRRAAEAPAERGEGGVPGTAFVAQKGRLAWPVKGELYRSFGTYSDPSVQVAVRNRGIDIRTGPDEPVRAVWGGDVVYADWFRGYGNLLIVDHGQKHFSVVSHLSRLSKAKGQPVEAGEIVGYAGDAGAREGPLVHFEIWRQGTPQNPMHWIRKRR